MWRAERAADRAFNIPFFNMFPLVVLFLSHNNAYCYFHKPVAAHDFERHRRNPPFLQASAQVISLFFCEKQDARSVWLVGGLIPLSGRVWGNMGVHQENVSFRRNRNMRAFEVCVSLLNRFHLWACQHNSCRYFLHDIEVVVCSFVDDWFHRIEKRRTALPRLWQLSFFCDIVNVDLLKTEDCIHLGFGRRWGNKGIKDGAVAFLSRGATIG